MADESLQTILNRLVAQGAGQSQISDAIAAFNAPALPAGTLDPTSTWLSPPSSPASSAMISGTDPNFVSAYTQSLLARGPVDLSAEYDRMQALAKTAASGPTQGELQAQQFGVEADEAEAIRKLYAENPVPPPERVETPDVPTLQLPPPPTAVQPQVNPVAQLAAAVAGLIDKHGAGEFNAAALEGSIKHAQQLTEQNQLKYQQEAQRLTAIHRDIQEQADRKIRVDVLNAETDNRRTLEQHNQILEAGQEAAKAAMLRGESSVLQEHETAAKPSREAAAELEATQARIKQISDDNKHLETIQTTAADTLARLQVSQQEHADALAAAAARQKEADATRAAIAKAQQDAQNARNAASIRSREKIAAAHDSVMRSAIDARKAYMGKGRAGSMVHDDGVTKAAWLALQTAERSYQAAKRASKEPSVSELSIPQDERDENMRQANADVQAAAQKFLEADADNRARQGVGVNPVAPATVTPPPGAHIRRYNPNTGKVE